MKPTEANGGEAAISAARQARIDLSAAHRMAVMHGLNEGIATHLTLAVPGRTDRFLLNPFGLHWSEVTATCLMEVGYDGAVLSGTGEVERTAFCIHAPIHQLGPQAACVMHTHMPYASALTRLADPRILAIGQAEITYLNQIAYDNTYNGFARDPAEGRRMGKVLGDKSVLFMAGHGVLVIGRTVAEAYNRLFYLERACQVQMYALWTGQRLLEIPPETVALQHQQMTQPVLYGGRRSYELHFDALKRILDRNEPDYRD